MGQAFDQDGQVLGEAFGETKREVFDKLTKDFKDAAEIRIKSLEDKASFVAGGVTKRDTVPDRMEQFFRYEHLPPRLQIVSKPFSELAQHVVQTLPSNPERTVALRKLLEAKDCAVRALLFE